MNGTTSDNVFATLTLSPSCTIASNFEGAPGSLNDCCLYFRMWKNSDAMMARSIINWKTLQKDMAVQLVCQGCYVIEPHNCPR